MSKPDGSAALLRAGSISPSTSSASASNAVDVPYAPLCPPARLAGPSGLTTPLPSEPPASVTVTSVEAAGSALIAAITSLAVDTGPPVASVARLTEMSVPVTDTLSNELGAAGSTYVMLIALPSTPESPAVKTRSALGPMAVVSVAADRPGGRTTSAP